MSTPFLKRCAPLWPLVLAAVVLLLACFPDSQNILRLQATALQQDQWWRLISAHWVHLGWQHTLLNALGFALIWYLRPVGDWYFWLTFYFIASLLISSALLYDSQISTYVGASGVLHGLLLLAAYYSTLLSPLRRLLFMGVIAVKLIWEQTHWYSSEDLDQLIGGFVVTDAHLWGGIAAGIALCLIELKKSIWFPSKER